MSHSGNVQIVAAAVTSQGKLCSYDEEEPAVWFRLIEAQFAMAGIKSQKLRYANVLASLPKQVLRNILDTIDVCNESDQPFNLLKEVLLGHFGKSKWQSYLSCSNFQWRCRASSPVSSWGSSNSIFRMVSSQTMTCFSQSL
jgi:hypothetical protein